MTLFHPLCMFISTRTETIGEQLQIFEAEAMVLKTWMTTAKLKLEDLQHLSEEDKDNIGNIRAKVEHILVSKLANFRQANNIGFNLLMALENF